MGLTVHALPAGVIRNFPSPAITYHRGWGECHDVPQIMFVIRGGDGLILVDSGTPPPDFVRRHHGYDFERPRAQEPRHVLAEADVDPADVHTVIFTHLHWDHCGNTELFPNARFLVQAEELRYAVDPAEPNRTAYEVGVDCGPPWFPVFSRIQTVRGRHKVAPGISVVPLPGHTPGSQGVLVEADGGRYLLAGDCVDTYENWAGDETAGHVPSGSFTNLLDYMDSFRLIEALACEVVPSHDARVLHRGVFQ